MPKFYRAPEPRGGSKKFLWKLSDDRRRLKVWFDFFWYTSSWTPGEFKKMVLDANRAEEVTPEEMARIEDRSKLIEWK